jgi:hypothetical protein
MLQTELWHDSILDALGAAVRSAGGAGTVAKKLWPALEEASRTARLRGCLNPDHPQKLDPEEFVLIGSLAKAAGDSSLMQYLAREWGYEVKALSPGESKKLVKRSRKLALLEQLRQLEIEE